MEVKPKFKDVDIGERSWRIQKFDARLGSYILFKFLGIISPIFGNLATDVKSVSDVKIDFTKALAGIVSLSEEDFHFIQDSCLKVCCEKLPSGFVDVLNSDGTFGVMNVADDIGLVMQLTIHALIFNVQGFFGESLLNSFPGLAAIIPQ